MGGHTTICSSPNPVFWLQRRKAGQPLVEQHPSCTARSTTSAARLDMLEMVKAENLLVFMPHPRSKGSTGYPDAIEDTPWFLDEHYRGIGVRWGMGLDGSETRLCEYRCQQLWDGMNNCGRHRRRSAVHQRHHRNLSAGSWRRCVCEQPGELREARRAAGAGRLHARSSRR